MKVSIRKRLVCMISAAIIASSLLLMVGCQNSTNKDVDVVKVWSNAGAAKAVFDSYFDRWNDTVGKEKGIKIEQTVYGSDYDTALTTALSTDQAAHIMTMSGNMINTQVANGKLVSLDAFAEEDGYTEFMKKYDGTNSLIVDSKVYSVPFSTTTYKLTYNEDLLKAAGYVDDNGNVIPPKTFDEVREYARQITNPGKGVYGIAYPVDWSGWISCEAIRPFVNSTGTQLFNSKTGLFDFEACVPAMEFLANIVADGSNYPITGLNNDVARAMFAAGKIGMKFSASWDAGVYEEQFTPLMNWGVCELPKVDGLDHYYYDYRELITFWKMSSAVNTSGVPQDKIWEVYKMLNSDDFLVYLYENGRYIPWNQNIISKAEKVSTIANWDKFCDLSNTVAYPLIPNVTLTVSEGETYTTAIEKILRGNYSKNAIPNLAKELDKRYNDKLVELYELGEKDDPSGLVKSDYFFPEFKNEKA